MKPSDNLKIASRTASDVLGEFGDELRNKIISVYMSHTWDNRYVLHPRRLKEMGNEELGCISVYLQTLDEGVGRELGSKRAEEGLAHKSLESLGGLFRQFYRSRLEGQKSKIVSAVMELIDLYMGAYLLGYMEGREEQILRDQEQLRIALSAALENQRRELFVKNYAIHTSINGIIIADLDRRITYANPAFLEMWGYDSENEVLNTPLSDLWGPDQADNIESSLMRGNGWQGEIACMRQNGEPFDVAISASLILDEKSNPVGAMTSLIDVTQRHHLEAQFRQAQKMEALGQLAGGIVHDFNNLLTAISGYAQLALMDLPETDAHYNDFLQIKTATDRGMDLTQELRIFTRQGSGNMEPLDANEVIEETFNILRRTFPPEIKLELKLDPSLKMTKANPSQLIQMLMNLCVNARDAVGSKTEQSRKSDTVEPAGGLITLQTENIALDVLTASRYLDAKPGEYVCISVQDTGTGMSPKIMDRLFEPFFTTKGEKKGTGLGLAVVYGIVQTHSGFIDLQSQVGEGSTFRIYLPVVEKSKAKSKTATYNPNLTSGLGTVLVADDDNQVMDMVLRALEKSGYSVITAENGLDAMAKYTANRDTIDLVVLDMVMPQMGGRECLLQLRKIDPSVKVLIMTGYTTDGSAEELLEVGAARVIQKPFELQAFTEAIRSLIDSTNSDAES